MGRSYSKIKGIYLLYPNLHLLSLLKMKTNTNTALILIQA